MVGERPELSFGDKEVEVRRSKVKEQHPRMRVGMVFGGVGGQLGSWDAKNLCG